MKKQDVIASYLEERVDLWFINAEFPLLTFRGFWHKDIIGLREQMKTLLSRIIGLSYIDWWLSADQQLEDWWAVGKFWWWLWWSFPLTQRNAEHRLAVSFIGPVGSGIILLSTQDNIMTREPETTTTAFVYNIWPVAHDKTNCFTTEKMKAVVRSFSDMLAT